MSLPYYNPQSLPNEVVKYWSKEEIAKREQQKKIRVPQKVTTKKRITKKTVTKKKIPVVLDSSKSLSQVSMEAQKPKTNPWVWGLAGLGALLWFI